MERIRLGNNIAISWALYDLNGRVHSLEDKEVQLYVSCGGLKQAVTDYTIQGNVVSWVFLGTEQKKVGLYKLILVETDALSGAQVVDVAEAFRLVSETLSAVETGEVTKNVSVRSVLTYSNLVGVESVDVVESSEDGGTNLVTIRLVDGNVVEIPIKNGSKGEKGNTGATGATGPKGDKGDVGERGPAGIDSVEAAIGTNDPTQAPSVDKDLTEGVLSLTFNNIKGGKGDQGEPAVAVENYVTVEATAQTTAATDVLPATGDADTVYRVANWDGTQYDDTAYTEYGWYDGAYKMLATRIPGIDDAPIANSQNLVKSGGVAAQISQLGQRLSGDIEELQNAITLIEESSIIDYIPSGTKPLSAGTYYAAIQSKQLPDRSAAGVLKYIRLLLAPEQNTSFSIRLYKKVWSDDIITGFTAVDGGTYSLTFPSGQTTMDVLSENIVIDKDVIIAISGLAKYADNITDGAFAVSNGAYFPAFDGKFSMNVDYVIEMPQKVNEVIQTINNDIQELKESGPVVKKDVSIIDYIPSGTKPLSAGTYYAAIQSKQLPDRSAAGVLKYIRLLLAPEQNTSFSIRLYKKVWSDDIITGFTAVDGGTYSLTFPSGQTTMDVLSENIVIDKDVIIAISGLAKYADNITDGAFAVSNGAYIPAFDGKFSMNVDYVIEMQAGIVDYVIEMQAGINEILDELNETIDGVKTLHNCNIAVLGDSITWLGGDNCDGVQGAHIGQGWTQYFKELAKPRHIQSFARSGATWSHTSSTKYNITENTGGASADNVIYNQINRLLASNQIPDIIIIAAGINDILFRSSALNVDADTAFADTDSYILDTPVGELTSIAEALRYDIELLKTNYPNAQIFVTTPLQCTTTSLVNCFRGGEIIKGCCKYLSLHCFDQAAEAGIYRAEESEEYFHTYDGLHTSVAGAKMVGQYLYRCVLSTARNLINP